MRLQVLPVLSAFIFLTACNLGMNSDSSSDTNSKTETQHPISEAAKVAKGELYFNKKHIGKNKVIGCVLCHSLSPNLITVGPSLVGLAIRAPHLVPDQTAQDYIKNSIINPDAYIVDGYLPSTMFTHYRQELSDEEIDALVAFLSLQ